MNILYVEKDCYSSKMAKDLFILSEHKLVLCDTMECAKNIITNRCEIGIILIDLKTSVNFARELLQFMEDKMCSIPVIIIDNSENPKSSQYYSRRSLVKAVYEKSTHLQNILKSINKFGIQQHV